MNRMAFLRIARHPMTFLAAGALLTVLLYAPGLSGGWLFDDYPNIVDNQGVQPKSHDLPSVINAALSSPASDLKRPLASLSFALNYLGAGLNAPAMKITNLAIHIANGLLVFLLLQAVIRFRGRYAQDAAGRVAALITTAWLLLPINLTSVLYVVQRMESLANFFVLLGLFTYVVGRRRMLAGSSGLALCVCGVLLGTSVGVLAKETAVMLPLYAVLGEIILFQWQRSDGDGRDRRLLVFFLLTLALPLTVGGVWLAPTLLNPETWSTRTFTLSTRLLSEARIVVDYIGWTLFPTPGSLSFYHDDFRISEGILQPWTTLASIVVLSLLLSASVFLRNRLRVVSLGIAWYLGCHLLTGTVLPLELVYEHRNYFASMGLLLAAFDLASAALSALRVRMSITVAVALLFLAWQAALTCLTAQSWGSPLSLARELAYRGPQSPRAQYELGRTYIIYSHYDPASPFIPLAGTALERAAGLEGSSILPEQALIFMNSRMHMPVKDEWWASMVTKLKKRPATVQDESSLDALASCLRETACHFETQALLDAFIAALSHPMPSARLLGIYSNFAWSSLEDRQLAIRVQKQAVEASPREGSYRVGLAKMSIIAGDFVEAHTQIEVLKRMNIGGNLDRQIDTLLSTLREAEETKSRAEPIHELAPQAAHGGTH